MVISDNIEDRLNGILDELGDFGKFQKINYFLLFFAIVVSSVYSISYIFTSSQLEYRYVGTLAHDGICSLFDVCNQSFNSLFF